MKIISVNTDGALVELSSYDIRKLTAALDTIDLQFSALDPFILESTSEEITELLEQFSNLLILNCRV